MKILIAYDGSDCADEALRDLPRAGLSGSHQALVVSVAEQWLPPPPPSSYETAGAIFADGILGGVVEANRQATDLVDTASSLAEQAAGVVKDLFPLWTMHSEAFSGSPAGEILERANSWEAELIVMGSHGRSGLGRLVPGSVSQRVVTDAPCSVRVSRGKAKQSREPAKIVVGVDGSTGARLAVNAVAKREWRKGSEVLLVSSVDRLASNIEEPSEKYAFIRSTHNASTMKLQELGLRVSSIIEEGDPRQMLIAEAKRWNADSIFVGARGLGRIGQLLLGSVSIAVVSRAHCSVEVTRAR